MRIQRLVMLAALAACDNGGTGSGLPDANLNLPMCTGQPYDSCNTNAECMSNNCHLFASDAIQVCTQACSATTPCPTLNGAAATCNNKGICKPPGANACHP